jgi:hypothetical protein
MAQWRMIFGAFSRITWGQFAILPEHSNLIGIDPISKAGNAGLARLK